MGHSFAEQKGGIKKFRDDASKEDQVLLELFVIRPTFEFLEGYWS